jgi:hypothetical protein
VFDVANAAASPQSTQTGETNRSIGAAIADRAATTCPANQQQVSTEQPGSVSISFAPTTISLKRSGLSSHRKRGALASLRRKRDKLMGLYLDDKITDDHFAEQERSLTAKIEAIEKDHSVVMTERKNKTILADAFEQAATLIRSPEFTLDAVWDNASQAERRVLVEELIEAVTIHADRLEVTVAGAPPLIVRPGEVGLRDPGTGPVVSKMGLELRYLEFSSSAVG